MMSHQQKQLQSGSENVLKIENEKEKKILYKI